MPLLRDSSRRPVLKLASVLGRPQVLRATAQDPALASQAHLAVIVGKVAGAEDLAPQRLQPHPLGPKAESEVFNAA